MINVKRNKSLIISFIIALGIFCIICKSIYRLSTEIKEENKIQDFFEKKNESSDKEIVTEVSNQDNSESYEAILEIQKINLRKGLYSINSKNNSLKKSIQVIKESNMPSEDKGNFILAGHSGSGSLAYFKNLHKLNKADKVYVYYQGIKYEYTIDKIYKVPKNGTVDIYRDYQKSTITLITCNEEAKDEQVVYIGYLTTKGAYS